MGRGRTHSSSICLRDLGYSQAFSQTYRTLLLGVITKPKASHFLSFTEVAGAGVVETVLCMINTQYRPNLEVAYSSLNIRRKQNDFKSDRRTYRTRPRVPLSKVLSKYV